ncbi:MAG: hypothetical protein CMH57_06135 [Myxococcales bacterium]|nr:hypothetical protein [Myxococcales bacterium]
MPTPHATEPMPIDPIRAPLASALRGQGRAVITAPTGSGKSTRVPIWCAEDGQRVLVVEPRRVACRSLARYVAHLMGTKPGEVVGYSVRYEKVYGKNTRVVFATPGTVLQMIQSQRGGRGLLSGWDVLIIDEFHERHTETDILLGFARNSARSRLIVMSATLEADRLGRHLDAEVLRGEGRMYPVSVEHLEQPSLPTSQGLEQRVVEATGRALREREGDVLIFLPGKGEIHACRSALKGLAREHDLEVLPLHGQLPVAEQDRVFDPGAQRRVIVSTNVAETSVTLPRIGVVIDSGLVRQTRYHRGDGVLKLVPIAEDSAEQRRGRAGRLGPGHCVRLWSARANLEAVTPPEILREDLTDTALMVATCGYRLRDLALPDQPPPYAVAAAQEQLTRLGCIDEAGDITEIGAQVARVPVSARHGRFVVAAQQRVQRGAAKPTLVGDALDLLGVLGAGRRLFLPPEKTLSTERQAWQETRCDASARIRALREGDPGRDGLSRATLAEARKLANQLRRQHDLQAVPRGPSAPDKEQLARAWLDADPSCGLARRRRGDAFGGGGTEMRLGRDSLIDERAEAIVVAESMSLSERGGRVVHIATCALPASLAMLRDAGLGRETVESARLDRRRLVCTVRTSFGGRQLSLREEIPRGPIARDGLLKALLQGSLFRDAIATSRHRISAWNLYRRVKHLTDPPALDLERWLTEQIDAIGFDAGDEVELLLEDDFILPWPAPMTPSEQDWLERNYPQELSLGGVRYTVEYSIARQTVTLVQQAGRKNYRPPMTYLPGAWSSWRIQLKQGNAVSLLRG